MLTMIENRPPRPLFQRAADYVVVRPFSIGVDQAGDMQPGKAIPAGTFPAHRLRGWHRRRRIGPKGHPWTEWMLRDWRERVRSERAADAARAPLQAPMPAAEVVPEPFQAREPEKKGAHKRGPKGG
jgi:hypothetical protein